MKKTVLKLIIGGLATLGSINSEAQNSDIHSDFSYGYYIDEGDTVRFDCFIESENYNYEFINKGHLIYKKDQTNFHFFNSKDENYFNWWNDENKYKGKNR